MNIIFPSYLGDSLKTDPFWEKEAAAASSQKFNIALLSESHFGSPLTVRSKMDLKKSLYRGWIMKPQVYREMSEIIESQNGLLYNSYYDYMWSYDFPKWYDELKNFTPSSLIIEADEISRLGLKALAEKVSPVLAEKSVLIKDYLKSRKHEWYDACFIRNASDINELIRVMSNFFNLQGRDFYGGLVFRDFINLKKIGFHPKSRMPLPLEFRTFFVKGKPVFTTPYWSNDVSYPENIDFPPTDWLTSVGRNIKSPFVALDIAQGEDDRWWVIEVNDGGSAGLPDHVNLEEFYKILSEIL